jgi:hypothetical protein
MISLKVEYSNNGRAVDNTIGCFKNIMSIHDYTHKTECMQDAIPELGEDIVECSAAEYDRRYNKSQYELGKYERFIADNGKPII